jgi:hypothetical protein
VLSIFFLSAFVYVLSASFSFPCKMHPGGGFGVRLDCRFMIVSICGTMHYIGVKNRTVTDNLVGGSDNPFAALCSSVRVNVPNCGVRGPMVDWPMASMS